MSASVVGGPGIGSDSVVARVGANAFTLLLVDVGNDAQAAQVAARLQNAVAAPIALRGRELVLTASIGIAMYPRDAGDTKGLARCAEQAAYAAKSAGRAQHHFFDEAMNALASERLADESDLRRAIAEGQLRLHYEALVRWLHPERGLVPPGQFIPLAEETGLILPLTDWVLETACADLRARLDAGLRSVPIAVNLAAPSFVHDGLLAQLDELLAHHRLDATCLVFEDRHRARRRAPARAARSRLRLVAR
jgi:predicted signal transduction protein with EAL and GGDEF domain